MGNHNQARRTDVGATEKQEEELLDATELAAALRVPVSWVYSRTRQEPPGLPTYRCGKYVRFSLREVLAFLRQ